MNTAKHLHLHMMRPDVEGGDWPRSIAENRVDGMLVIGHATDWFYRRLGDVPIPAVAVNESVERTHVDCVLGDPTPGIQDAVNRLLALGHRSIGLVVTDPEFATVNRRLQAYRAALRQGGIEPDPRWIIERTPQGLRGGQRAIATYMASNCVPSAIIFNDDWIAMGGVYELARQGLRVPEDVSIVGYDNTPISEELTPSLCSVDNREKRVMAAAMEMLQQRIDGLDCPARQCAFASRLVWRESCAAARNSA